MGTAFGLGASFLLADDIVTFDAEKDDVGMHRGSLHSHEESCNQAENHRESHAQADLQYTFANLSTIGTWADDANSKGTA